MQKIGILSDTHGMLRPEVLEKLEGCDLILHGGDINRKEILERLEEIAPVYAVRGNNDKEWAEYLPETLSLEVESCRIFMVHNKKQVPKELADIDVIIFGHSHKYSEQSIDHRVWLNPGSCGKRRFDQEITFALMEVDGKNISIEKVAVSHKQK